MKQTRDLTTLAYLRVATDVMRRNLGAYLVIKGMVLVHVCDDASWVVGRKQLLSVSQDGCICVLFQ